MAKGDDSRARNQVNYQGNLSQNHLNNLRTDTIVPQNQTMWNNYTDSVDKSKADYGNIMSDYQKFADNGGYSPQDISSMRARAIAPTRAVYQNGINDIGRQTRLSGGYAPNAIAARAKMSRDMSSSISDTNTNVEAALAQMVNEGKRFGVAGKSQLYGTTPGAANMFGNQVLASTAQQLELARAQNDLGLGISSGQINAGRLPGKMDSTLDQIQSGANIIKTLNPYSAGA